MGADAVHMSRPLLLIVGAPGAGKSSLARQVAARTGVVLLDRDTFFAPLAAVALPQLGLAAADLDSPMGKALSAGAYESLELLARDNLAVGNAVVLEAPYSKRVEHGWFSEISRRLGQAPLIIWRSISLDQVQQRILDRALPRDEQTLLNWDRFTSSVVLGAPGCPHLEIPAELPLEVATDLTVAASRGRKFSFSR